MKNFGKAVVALRIPILIVSVLLLIPAALGYIRTRTNYDVLSYLPGETPESPPVSVFILCISRDAEMLAVAGVFPSVSDLQRKGRHRPAVSDIRKIETIRKRDSQSPVQAGTQSTVCVHPAENGTYPEAKIKKKSGEQSIQFKAVSAAPPCDDLVV